MANIIKAVSVGFTLSPTYDIYTQGLEKEQSAKTKREAAALVTPMAISYIAAIAALQTLVGLGIATAVGVAIPLMPVIITIAVAVISTVGFYLLQYGKYQFNKALDKKDAEMSFEEKTEKLEKIVSNFNSQANSASKLKNLVRCAKIVELLVEGISLDQAASLNDLALKLYHNETLSKYGLSGGLDIALYNIKQWQSATASLNKLYENCNLK